LTCGRQTRCSWRAALEWCEDAPQGRVFLTADQKLRDAALLAGFDARQM
jgi:hypothetical protein